MEEQQDSGRALSFGRVAEVYDRARPDYPVEAVRWLLEGGPWRVLELGAGTGKLTRTLRAEGHRVLATDPDAEMLAVLRDRCPDVPAVRAAAERLPGAPRSFDAVVAGQAFHWFDAPKALPQVAKVLRPGGLLALLWNRRDERIPWVKRLGSVIGRDGSSHDPTAAIRDSGLFGPIEHRTFRFWLPLDREALHDLVLSRSAVSTLPEPEREAVLAQVDEIYDGYGRGHDGMLLPYVTHAYRAPRATEPDSPADDVESPTPDSLLIDFR